MSIKISIKKFLENNFITEFFNKGNKISHDWKIMLVILVFLMIITVISSGYVFGRINEGTLFQAMTKEKKSESIDRVSLEEVVRGLNQKDVNFRQIQNGIRVGDPSI